MKTIQIGGKPFSQMSLGTVQLGMNYGIANSGGRPSLQQSFAVLQSAIDGGVTALDTAAAYGESETVIGRFLRQRGGSQGLFITTKFFLELPDGAPARQVKDGVRASLQRSLERLGVDSVDCLMLHRSRDFTRFGDAVPEALRALIGEGLIHAAGMSVYHPQELESALAFPLITMVQAPMNAFDHELRASGMIAELARREIALIVRSVFLQGLFFLNPGEVTDPDLIAAAVPKLHLVREIAAGEGMSVAQLAVAYIRDMPGVTGIVLGAEQPEQVTQNLALFSPEAPRLSPQARSRIDGECQADIARIMKVLSRPKA